MAATPGRLATLPKVALTLGLYELWRRRNTAIVTDKRIMFGSGIVKRSEKSIPLSKVIDVSFSRRGLNSYAEVTVTDRGQRKNRLVGPMSAPEARPLRQRDPRSHVAGRSRLDRYAGSNRTSAAGRSAHQRS